MVGKSLQGLQIKVAQGTAHLAAAGHAGDLLRIGPAVVGNRRGNAHRLEWRLRFAERSVDLGTIVQLDPQMLLGTGSPVFQAQQIAPPTQLADTLLGILGKFAAEAERQFEAALQQAAGSRLEQVDEAHPQQAEIGQRTTTDQLVADQPEILELMETPPACQGAQTPPHGTTQVVIAVVDLRGRHIEHPQTRLAIGLDQRLHGYPPLLLQACGAQPGRRRLAERPPHCSDPNGQNQGPIRPVLRIG